MAPRSHRVRANGLVHHVLEWEREGASATALLVHGFQDAGATWDVVASALSERYGLRVLVPDLRGFGDTDRVPPGGYYYFPDYVADVAAQIDALVTTPLLLVGHSMGATVVSYAAGALPERVTKLVLVDGVGPPDNSFGVAPVRMRRWLETKAIVKSTVFATKDEGAERLGRYNPDIDRAVLARKAEQLLRPVEGGWAWAHDPLHSTVSPVTFYAEAYKAFAREVTCPVLYVSGGPRGFHVEDEDARLGCFAQLTKKTIDGGHALHWSRPAELAETIGEFWKG